MPDRWPSPWLSCACVRCLVELARERKRALAEGRPSRHFTHDDLPSLVRDV